MRFTTSSRLRAFCYTAIGLIGLTIAPVSAQKVPNLKPEDHQPSAAYQWLDIILEASARDVERVGAQPTILSRQMAIPCTAMYDAWAAYDTKAVGTIHGAKLRQPKDKRTPENRATYRTTVDQLPHFEDFLTMEMKKMGYDPMNKSLDKNNLERDVKMFFCVANTAFDTFIASWDSKRYYDSSRPWTLVRYYFAGQPLQGWAGPGKGVMNIPAEKWHPYSPSNFVTPPSPGYVSGHSCVSGGCAEMLKLFTGGDPCGLYEARHAGEITEQGFSCKKMQQLDGTRLELGQGFKKLPIGKSYRDQLHDKLKIIN